MSELQDRPAPPREGEELNPAAIRAYLDSVLPQFDGDIAVRQFPGGASNLTYLLTIGDRQLVLRRPPFGTKAKSAHDMDREYRILSRLSDVFRYCPRPLAYCDDPLVLGEPFYLMERIEGIVLRRELPPGLSLDPAAAGKLCRNLIDVHLELHSIDIESAGLRDLGKPQGYIARQVDGWSGRFRNARTEDVPDNEALMDWLKDNQPSDTGRGAIIHNDYKFDNVVLGQHDLGIIGVLDWEMATLGDPLMDLGCSLAYWIQEDDTRAMQQLRMMPTQLPGMMNRRELVDYYSERAGVAAGDFRFYYAFGLFRLAVIVQQIYFRFARGQTRDRRFADFGQMCSLLSGTALAVTRGQRSL